MHWRLLRRHFLTAFVSLGTVVLASGADSPKKLTIRDMFEANGYVSVPFKVADGNQLFVEGKIGKTSVRCGIDTGWGDLSAITQKVGRKFGVPVASPGEAAGKDKFVAITGLHLGGYAFPSNSFRLFNLSTDRYNPDSLTKHVAFSGGSSENSELMIGFVDLLRHHAIINYPQKVLHFRTELPAGDQLRSMQAALKQVGYTRVEMKVPQAAAFLVPCRLNEEPGELLVDTGASATVIHEGEISRLTGKQATTLGVVRGVKNRESSVGLVKLARFRVGDWEQESYEIAVADLTPWNLGTNRHALLKEVRGMLGGDILGLHGALVDCGTKNLFLLTPGR